MGLVGFFFQFLSRFFEIFRISHFLDFGGFFQVTKVTTKSY